MKAYSMDLRERLVAAGGGGMRKAAAARVYAVGLSTVKRYARQQATAGHLRAKSPPGRARAIPVADAAALRARAAAHADATLDDHRRRRADAQGAAVSRATMSRAFARADLPLKKSRCAPPSGMRRRGRRGARRSPPATRRRWCSWTRAGRLSR